MKILVGMLSVIGGIAIWIFGITVLLSWIIFCFSTVIIGILLLIFAPKILTFPYIITVPGTLLIMYGLAQFK